MGTDSVSWWTFNGTIWTAVPAPPVAGVSVATCTATACVADGFAPGTSTPVALFFQNGAWGAPQPLPFAPGPVSCTSPTFCSMVYSPGRANGSPGGQPQEAAVYNGSTWTAIADNMQGDVLGISCSSSAEPPWVCRRL